MAPNLRTHVRFWQRKADIRSGLDAPDLPMTAQLEASLTHSQVSKREQKNPLRQNPQRSKFPPNARELAVASHQPFGYSTLGHYKQVISARGHTRRLCLFTQYLPMTKVFDPYSSVASLILINAASHPAPNLIYVP